MNRLFRYGRNGVGQGGSALLIVLGFLSFMMISAVSFAIFMRIERQASSNYRHAITARHMLNAGLVRAIDEVDRHLRDVKFPPWPGRVYPGGTNTLSATVQDTRVLSLESLSFLPGIFVNDVRYQALTGDTRPIWRQLSMPINFNSGENAFGGAEVGRFAFVCVNLSDMLNVNAVSAAQSGTNRINIGHLFRNDGAANTFDNNKQNLDRRYETLQDFYACMFERNDPTFGSPYHKWLDTGDDLDFGFVSHHVLITDGIVKPEPGNANAFAITENKQPIKNLGSAIPSMDPVFQTALGNALVGGLRNQQVIMAPMIADYLDNDHIPKRFDIPTVEMTPMVSEIRLLQGLTPIIKQELVPDTSPPETIYYLQMTTAPGPQARIIEVEVTWPFKHHQERSAIPNYSLEVKAFMKIIPNDGTSLNSASFAGGVAGPQYIPLSQAQDVPIPNAWNTDGGDPNACYKKCIVHLDITQQNLRKNICRSSTKNFQLLDPQFVVNQPFCVALVLFVSVKQGDQYVDIVPHGMSNPNLREPYLESVNKLFFRTAGSHVVVAQGVDLSNGTLGRPLPFVWNGLEVPDPRFNYRVANWVKSGGSMGAVNASTTALLGQDGRDGDIYLSVSDLGRMCSPGELGFIVRPFPHRSGNQDAGVDFDTHTLTDTPDHAHFYRTIRLYDHGGTGENQRRDRIFEYFTEGDPHAVSSEMRVNPLSDLPQVLVAALQNTPVDWFCANEKREGRDFPVFNDTDLMSASTWRAFTNGWLQCVEKVRNNTTITTARDQHLSIHYGDQQYFDWYAGQNPRVIFGQTLSDPLHEVDRKMLFSWSIANFSDRQQLFLYVLRAEATVPSFGGSDMGGVKSVAGGRAVALVWRDPYPVGYPDNMVSDPANFHEHRVLFFKQLDN